MGTNPDGENGEGRTENPWSTTPPWEYPRGLSSHSGMILEEKKKRLIINKREDFQFHHTIHTIQSPGGIANYGPSDLSLALEHDYRGADSDRVHSPVGTTGELVRYYKEMRGERPPVLIELESNATPPGDGDPGKPCDSQEETSGKGGGARLESIGNHRHVLRTTSTVCSLSQPKGIMSVIRGIID